MYMPVLLDDKFDVSRRGHCAACTISLHVMIMAVEVSNSKALSLHGHKQGQTCYLAQDFSVEYATATFLTGMVRHWPYLWPGSDNALLLHNLLCPLTLSTGVRTCALGSVLIGQVTTSGLDLANQSRRLWDVEERGVTMCTKVHEMSQCQRNKR